MVLGWGDPLKYLALSEDDALIADAVVQEALEVLHKMHKTQALMIANASATAIANALVRALR